MTVDLRTLPVVLEDLHTQIKLDQLSNRIVRQNFSDDLTRLLARKWVRTAYLRQINNVVENLRTWHGWRTLLHLVERTRSEVETTFPERCATTLADVVSANSLTDTDRLQLIDLSNDLIVEFLSRGFAPSFVQTLPDRLASGYQILDPGHIDTDFPHTVEYDTTAPEEHANSVAQYLESLTWRDRALAILRYINRPKKSRRYIFQLRGLRIVDSIRFGQASIYNPFFTKRAPTTSPFPVDETFGQDSSEHTQFPNIEITVMVNTTDSAGAKALALAECERHVDVLAAYLHKSTPLIVKPESYIVIDDESSFASSGWARSEDDPLLHFSRSADLEIESSHRRVVEALQDPATHSYLAPNTQMERRISLALAAVRRAESTSRADQRVLSYWMAIETLLDIDSWRAEGLIDGDATILTLAFTALEPLYFQRHVLFSTGWALHGLLSEFVHNGGELPLDIVARCSLSADVGKTIALRPLLDSLDEILANLRTRDGAQYLADKVDQTRLFYKKPEKTLAVIGDVSKRVHRELMHVYRARNRLVHGAYDRTLFLDAIGDRAGLYAQSLLHHALDEHPKNDTDFRHSLAGLKADLLTLIACLKSGIPINLNKFET